MHYIILNFEIEFNRPILTPRTRTHLRNVIARVYIGDRSYLLRWSEQEKSACMTFIAVRKDEQETAESVPISSIYLGYGQAAERV